MSIAQEEQHHTCTNILSKNTCSAMFSQSSWNYTFCTEPGYQVKHPDDPKVVGNCSTVLVQPSLIA